MPLEDNAHCVSGVAKIVLLVGVGKIREVPKGETPELNHKEKQLYVYR